MFTLNPPEMPQKETLPPITMNVPNKISEDNKGNLVEVLSDIKGLKNTFRYIKLNENVVPKKSDLIPSKKQIEGQGNQIPIDRQIFIRPTQSVVNGNKTFWFVKGLK